MGNIACCGGGLPPQNAEMKTIIEVEEMLREYSILASDETKLDVRGVTLLLWKARNDPKLPRILSDLLSLYLDDRDVFRGIEFYLPQLVHLMIHLDNISTTSVLEEFVLLVAQQSLHLALRIAWILIGSLEDYLPLTTTGKANPMANTMLCQRIAGILVEIERAVVFTGSIYPKLEDLLSNSIITREEFHEMAVADRKFRAFQLASVDYSMEGVYQGYLHFQRKVNIAKLELKKRTWKLCFCIVRHRYLWIHDSQMTLKCAIPLEKVEILENKRGLKKAKEPHGMDMDAIPLNAIATDYFELRQTLPNKSISYRLYPNDPLKKEIWMKELRKEADSAPLNPFTQSTDDVSSHAHRMQNIRYGFYRSEMEFVSKLTGVILVNRGCIEYAKGICEELRFVEKHTRKQKLREKLQKLHIPGCTYLPTCTSTDTWERVDSVLPLMSTAFSTKERCPCQMTFRVIREAGDDVDVATYLQHTLSHSYDRAQSALQDVNISGNVNSMPQEATISESITRQQSSASSVGSDRDFKITSLWTEDQSLDLEGNLRKRLLTDLNHFSALHAFKSEMAPETIEELNHLADHSKSQALSPELEYIPSLGTYSRKEKTMSVPIMPEENEEKEEVTRKIIAKSHDDLRQEVFTMQLLQFLHDIWSYVSLPLFLRPFNVLSTAQSCGMLDFLVGTKSLDGIKKDFRKRKKYIRLLKIFEELFPKKDCLDIARRAFTESAAGYCLATYILGIKDRHNGNIMLDKNTGRIIHIDFGFVLGMAPGKDKIPGTNFSLERAPFKLTKEMVEVIGGYNSENWKYFITMMSNGLLEVRKHKDTLLSLVEMTGFRSKYPCFTQPGGGVQRVMRELKERLLLSVPDSKIPERVKSMSMSASKSKGTLLYEIYQQRTQGLAPIF